MKTTYTQCFLWVAAWPEKGIRITGWYHKLEGLPEAGGT